jgi:hypothetical protein
MISGIESAKRKVARANEHLDALKGELARYYATNPAHFVADPTIHTDSSGEQYVFGRFKEVVPSEQIAVIIGDLLQNLRSALDYLVWELVLANKEQPGKNNSFPICDFPKSFANELRRGRLDGVHSGVLADVEGLQPYFGGADVDKSFLWNLEQFSNINKHRRVLLTVLRTLPAPEGMVTTRDASGMIHAPVNPALVNSNTQIGPVRVIDGKVQMNPPVIGFVGFAEGPPKGYEVWSFLEATVRFVPEQVLPRFERFF